MNKRSTFNALFQAGMTYNELKLLPSERLQQKMDDGYVYAKEMISNIPDQLVQRLNQNLRVLFITHIRCKDSANALPVLAGLVERLDNWKMAIVHRDDFDNEIEAYYLTAGRKKVPVGILAGPWPPQSESMLPSFEVATYPLSLSRISPESSFSTVVVVVFVVVSVVTV